MSAHDPRNVGRMRSRTGRSERARALPLHYLTAREAKHLAGHERRKNEARGVFRRWNGRKLTAEQEQLAAEARARTKFRGKRRQPSPIPPPQP